MRRILTAMLTVMMLSSCSSQFAYNNLDWLAYWYIDDYIELDKAQKNKFDIHLSEWLRWHRTEELVKYQNQLKDLKNIFHHGPITAEQVVMHFDQGRQHWVRLRSRLTPELSQFAEYLNEAQIEALFAELEKQNAEWEEELAEESEETLADKEEDLASRVKEHIGKLTNEQQTIVAVYAPKFTNNSREWLAYRRVVQLEAKKLFEQRKQNASFIDDLHELMNNPEAYRHAELRHNSEQNRLLYAEMLAEISQTLTSKQKQRLLRKIDNLIDDLQDLIDDA